MRGVSTFARRLAASSVTTLLAACGGTVLHEEAASTSSDGSDGSDGGGGDAAGTVPLADGATDEYPAPHTPLPPVTYNGGDIIEAPKLVTVTFGGDEYRETLESFGKVITTTKWWDATTREYCDARGKCVGHGSGVGVRLTDTLLSIYQDSAMGGASTLQALIDAHIQDGTLPPPDPETIYVLYFPSVTSVDLDYALSCEEYTAYHNAMSSTPPGATAPVRFAYAVIPRCSVLVDDVTVAASHEIVEAVTDPFVSPTRTYDAYGSFSDAWDYASGGELADRCVDSTQTGLDHYVEGPFVVQRTWSNAAARASHDPCVPAPSEVPYFNVGPRIGGNGHDIIAMKIGETATIPVIAFSDAPTGPISVTATEIAGQVFGGVGGVLDLHVTPDVLENGQVGTVTVKLLSKANDDAASFVITSSVGATFHTWSFLITAK